MPQQPMRGCLCRIWRWGFSHRCCEGWRSSYFCVHVSGAVSSQSLDHCWKCFAAAQARIVIGPFCLVIMASRLVVRVFVPPLSMFHKFILSFPLLLSIIGKILITANLSQEFTLLSNMYGWSHSSPNLTGIVSSTLVSQKLQSPSSLPSPSCLDM